jgi:thymidylate synthase
LYNDHIEQAKEQLSRKPFSYPSLSLNKEVTDINKFKMSDIELVGYQSHEAIKAPMAV